MIAATRLRKGPSNSARGAAAFVAETIRTARACGASGLLVLRADSAFYGADVINACRALGARFSITMRMNASVKATIARIDEDAWTPIKYPQAVWDEEGQCWISDAEIAEIRYTAFTSKPKKQQVTARLIARRVKRLSAGTVPAGQGTLFDTWRYHAAFTDSPLALRDAERDHRRHAVVEQVIADVKNSGFAHAPSGHFQANAAWLALAALTRAAGALASAFHTRATTATIRDRLINVPALCRSETHRSCSRVVWRAITVCWNPVRLIVSLVYQVTRKLLTVPAMRLRRDTAKNAELSCCGTRTRCCAGSSRGRCATNMRTGCGSQRCPR
ncbi:transposase [Streptomyces violaceusniger]|uniref:transposase n=1 Tax=Streptomyces violaceusniger TaxID=68280 RepID=UPI0009C37A93|nr:transposase [Streptomyces hygroscopicus]